MHTATCSGGSIANLLLVSGEAVSLPPHILEGKTGDLVDTDTFDVYRGPTYALKHRRQKSFV